ncbi:MAG: hypothetical protein WA715_05865 [Candidatus Acidiferrum sp.]
MDEKANNWRVIVVGGHTRSIGKTQLACDLISAIPEANWIAGKITQYGHGVCAQNGRDCDCAPDEHICAIDWEKSATSGTDSARFLAAGAKRSFWLRTKQGFLAEGMPLLRKAIRESSAAVRGDGDIPHVILESNSLLQFLKPSLYLMVVHPARADFKESAQLRMDRVSAFVLREPLRTGRASQIAGADWLNRKGRFPTDKPQFLQREGEPLPSGLIELVRTQLRNISGVQSIKM